ncbi:MAG: amidohydrolase [Acidobacteria bacterium]|nr:amidohydrolase [Acidobacteriota bacterium]
MIIDAHTHIIAADRDRYPFRRPAGGGLRWPEEHPLSVEGLIKEMNDAGVGAAIVVQPSVYGTDNRYVIESAAGSDRLVAIAIVDVDDGHFDETANLCAQRRCGGVRLFDVPPSEPSFLDDGRATAVAKTIAAAGGRVCVCALEPALGRVASLAASIPNTTLVLEHCGFADFTDGPPFARAQPLFDLASHPGVVLKVTPTSLLEAETAGVESSEVVAALAEHFGADRLMWGSDSPFQVVTESYEDSISLVRDRLDFLSDTDRKHILNDTAERVFFFK